MAWLVNTVQQKYNFALEAKPSYPQRSYRVVYTVKSMLQTMEGIMVYNGWNYYNGNWG